MADIDTIVNVAITANTKFPSREGFGIPCFLAYHTRFAEDSRLYGGTSEMLEDGFTVNDNAYKMAASAWAQNPSLATIRIGRLPAPPSAQITQLDCSAVQAGETIAFSVISPDGTVTEISEVFDTSATITGDNLETALSAVAGLTAANTAGVVEAEADDNGPQFAFADVSGPCSVLDITGDWAYDTQFGVIQDQDPDFYAVAVDVNSNANIVDVAAWAATNGKIAAFGPQVTDPSDYATTGNALDGADTGRAFSLVKRTSRAMFPECAWLGECLPYDAGSQTWAFKQLAGQTPDAWSTSERAALEAYNANHYTRVKGVNITYEGRTHGGEFIDITRGIDWLLARIQERILALKIGNRKIPFTDSGIQMVVTEVDAQLQIAEDPARSVLSPGETVITFKTVAQLEASDRGTRTLRGIKFTGRLAGAVHKTHIEGTVSV